MNFTKKVLLLTLTLSLFSLVECMQQQGGQFDNQEQTERGSALCGCFRPGTKTEAITKKCKRIPFVKIGNYLTQLASIYSIDSADKKVVDILAKLRIMFNGIFIYKFAKYLYDFGLNFELPSMEISNILTSCVRCYNIFKDIQISKNSDAISSSNKSRKDKNLEDKKRLHYVWLTLNTLALLPCLHEKLKINRNNIGYYTYIVQRISELYRQYLMYEMIENKQVVK